MFYSAKKNDTCIAAHQKYLKLGHLILNNIVGGKDRHTTILHTAVDPFLSTSPIKAVICALEVCLLKINQNKTEIQTLISTQVFRFGSMPLPFLQRYQSYQKFLLIKYPQSNNYYYQSNPIFHHHKNRCQGNQSKLISSQIQKLCEGNKHNREQFQEQMVTTSTKQ